jgi:hypothetical protein
MLGRKWWTGKNANLKVHFKANDLFKVSNGQLADEVLIKMAEAMSPNNVEQLQKDLVAVDECSKISKKFISQA